MGARSWNRQDIARLMGVDPLPDDRFRAPFNERNAYSALFGGQLLGQALAAADATVAGKHVHSLHAHFIRSGSVDEVVNYQIEKIRDGARLSLRRVTGLQGNREICSVTCSYCVDLEGYEHQAEMPAVDLAGAIDAAELARSGKADPFPFIARYVDPQPVELRIPAEQGFNLRGHNPKRHYWLRTPSMAAVDDPAVHRQVLAYLSDYLLVGAALVPHTTPLPGAHIFVTSLDHAVWFHRPVRTDDWLLFVTESPSSHAGLALSRGLIFDQSGALVATTTQESLKL